MARLYGAVRRRFNHHVYRAVVGNICDPILMDLYPLPQAIRPMAYAAARSCGAAVEGFINLPNIPVRRIANGDWTFLHYGSDHGKEDVLHLFFKDGADVTDLGRVPSWNLRAHVASGLDQGTDLIIYERPGAFFPRSLRAPIAFEIPTWIDQCISLPASPGALFAGRSRAKRRNLINQCQRKGYMAQVSHEISDLEEFYHSVHKPFIAARHGPRARWAPYKDAVRSFRRGALIKIMLDGRLVAGTICYMRNGTCYSTIAGIDLSGIDDEKGKVNVFLDWHCVLYAYEQKALKANIGGTLPWISDGLYQKKKRWGSRVTERNRTCKKWEILSREIPASLRDYLNALGPITHRDGLFFGVHLVDPNAGIPESDAAALAAELASQGLSGLALVEPGAPLRTVMAVP